MSARLATSLAGAMILFAGMGCPTARDADRGAAPPGMVMVPAGVFIMGAGADDGFNECRKFAADCRREWCAGEGERARGTVTN